MSNTQKYIYSGNSTIGKLLKSPVGYDIAERLMMAMGKDSSLLSNRLLRSIRLKGLVKLSGGLIDNKLVDILVDLLNKTESMTPVRTEGEYVPKWWKEMILYQIYPRSFCDSNGDGIGDLPGIISKLDYIKKLGVNAIWMSPICDSPNDDNGYDIRDYRAIMQEFGTMEDFDRLLTEAHSRGIRVIMDMVFNHSSDEHKWFKAALAGDKKYQDFYYFRDGQPDAPPNNWISFFSGCAWNYYPELRKWALHTFSKKQMDLNWNNPDMRSEIYDIMNFWLDKGVDGFRLDVISFIGKDEQLPNGSQTVSQILGFRGVEHYFFGEHLHKHLREMREHSLSKYDCFTVGETPGTGMRMNQMLTAEPRKELDTVICFDHLDNPGKNRYDDYEYDLRHVKRVFTDWQLHYGKDCWNVLFFENHDNPRMISKVSTNPKYRDVIGKLLAVILLTLCGTPIIYQGQELGMINTTFSEDELRDVEAINMLAELKEKLTPEAGLARINAGARDHARVPMQWNGDKGIGFTDGEGWIKVGERSEKYNAAAEDIDDQSILTAYRQLITLRNGSKALVYGDFVPAKQDDDSLFCYYRSLDGESYYIEINLTPNERKCHVNPSKFTLLFSNYDAPAKRLRPYEANIYRK